MPEIWDSLRVSTRVRFNIQGYEECYGEESEDSGQGPDG